MATRHYQHKTIAGAARTEDRAKLLRALRARLATDLDACTSARDVVAISRQLADLAKQLDALAPPAAKTGSHADEVAARRAARGANTKNRAQSGRR